MKEDDYSAIVERYRNLPDEEVLQLHQRKADLLPIAQQVLEQEVARRGVRIEALKQTRTSDAASDLAWQEEQVKAEAHKQARLSRRMPWYLAVVSPLVALSFTLESAESREHLVRPLTLVATLLTLYWVVFAVQWFLSVKDKRGTARDA